MLMRTESRPRGEFTEDEASTIQDAGKRLN